MASTNSFPFKAVLGELQRSAVLRRVADQLVAGPICEFRLNLEPPETTLVPLERVRGPILFGDAGLALRSGRPPLLLDKFNASYLADRGRLDCSTLATALSDGTVEVVVRDTLDFEYEIGQVAWWPRPLIPGIVRNYRPNQKLGGQRLYILIPQPEPAGR